LVEASIPSTDSGMLQSVEWVLTQSKPYTFAQGRRREWRQP
jgi:hypothetical protein